jgi:hypothetical protein
MINIFIHFLKSYITEYIHYFAIFTATAEVMKRLSHQMVNGTPMQTHAGPESTQQLKETAQRNGEHCQYKKIFNMRDFNRIYI